MNEFESKFDYLEHVIEVRVESLYNELDKLGDYLKHEVDLFENRMIENKSDNKPLFFKIKSKSKYYIEYKNIGIFYNEFDDDWYKFHDEHNIPFSKEKGSLLKTLKYLI